ncbi:DUF1028 domain-containing protein [Rhodococcus hoagii]|nr:DUF1028 domain-containing protein [Prescottella equi]
MTYSVVARWVTAPGQLGVATATSDVAVGARVPWLRTGAARSSPSTAPIRDSGPACST